MGKKEPEAAATVVVDTPLAKQQVSAFSSFSSWVYLT